MAVTAKQAINSFEVGQPYSFPVKSGEVIYQGTVAGVGKDGYLYDLDSAAIPEVRIIGIVADDSANAGGAAATTASGSLANANIIESSAVAGDKTWRNIYLEGKFLMTFTAIAQSDVGKVVYASDNYTLDESMTGAVKIGTLVKYISATKGIIALNQFYNADGTILLKYALTAVTGTTAGGILSKANPFGEPAIVEHFYIDITTGSTGAATADFGIAANGTTSSDTLIDGYVQSLVAVASSLVNGGTNGGVRKWGASEYLTGTASATLAGEVGTCGAVVRIWE